MASWLHTVRHRLSRLVPPGSRVCVATSGGPDSQVLLDLAARWRAELGWAAVCAVGVDHGLRPEAAGELALARDLADSRAVAFYALRVDLGAGNLLQRARRARFAALMRHAHRWSATAVLIAHTATDQAETVLHHLCRGTALRGAGAMAARRGLWVRPLLDVERGSIEEYVRVHALTVARDPSNHDRRRVRTHVRAELAPRLTRINARALAHIAAFARTARRDERYLVAVARKRLAESRRGDGWLDKRAVTSAHPAIGRRVLACWLRRYLGPSLPPHLVERVWNARKSAYMVIGQRAFTVTVDRGRLWCKAAPALLSRVLHGEDTVELPLLGRALTIGTMTARWPLPAEFRRRVAQSVAFDADHLHFGLVLRNWRAGDKLRPYGLDGHCSVSDVLSQARVHRGLRARWPVVTHGDDLLWVVGLRRGQQAPVTKTTQRMVSLELSERVDEALSESAW